MAFPSKDALHSVISPIAQSHGMDVEEVKINRAGAKSVIAIIVDAAASAGMDAATPGLEAVEVAAGDISTALDEAEAAGQLVFGAQEYTLEVSTPGVDRPLTTPRHWHRNRGRLVAVTLGDRQLRGRVGALDSEHTSVIVISQLSKKEAKKAGRKAGELDVHALGLGDIDRAVVEIEFANAPAAETQLADMSYENALQWREDHK
ncbi:ribosome maturation factor RimP [Corynebacterium ciconiae]|uniref:ribosome maturation factor RimP n=1 Tax=Corynebacterium ciconiae TaxID=227319 RepID=UPI00047694D6|nr:ribosome maturation factor RimP [Corynebacterium ciconiae]